MNKDDIEYIEQAEIIVWKLATIVKGNIELLEKIDKQIEHKLPHLRVNIEEAILMQMRTYQKVNELFPRLDDLENTYVRNPSNQLSLTHRSINLDAPRIWNIINIVSKLKPSSRLDFWHNNLEPNPGISLSASYVRKPKLVEQDTNIEADHQSIDLSPQKQLVQDNLLEAKYVAPQRVTICQAIVKSNKQINKNILKLDNKVEKDATSHKIFPDKSINSESTPKQQTIGNKKYTDYLKSVGISGKIGQLAIIEPIITSSNLVLKRD
ncbi:hypothetical protein [Paenibacillus endoradicis]|uniref:hypothetical protein n=1 Tax=Paenibacillus endoradicis TaxID=2972487 RepID=UPI002158A7B2|nr:hypothetical protein [Paenibacillus endoradicis]MCR8656726.1 hypothetical protein [Paenibacillus endoradicis]